MKAAVLTPADLESQLRATDQTLAEATRLAAKLASMRTKTARYTFWASRRDRLQAERAELRQALSLFGVGASQ